MSVDEPTRRNITQFYDATIKSGGTTPQGVQFNSAFAQEERFRQLLRIVDTERTSLLDYGCGYGELYRYVADREPRISRYEGYDITSSMIEAARSMRLCDRAVPASFTDDRSQVARADYVVASGLFNIPFTNDHSDWIAHIERTLDDIASLAERGFAFNMLTTYSDPEKMRPELFYGDPHHYFRSCRKYSRRVALLHDYELYDFTILVRRDG